jgi:peptidoglycan/xylan/chitin deacetylase (PgdA/CDA1 family)
MVTRRVTRCPIVALLALVALAASEARAAPCGPRADALGTHRVLALDPKGVKVGLQQFSRTLDLAAREVVLTFDDGPDPRTTPMVLAALARECVRATFFLIGREAEAHPELAKRIVAEGHTVAHHSMTHPLTLTRLPYAKAIEDIERGIKAVEHAAFGSVAERPRVPFFRFPGFGQSPALLAYMEEKGLAVFGSDLWASDWIPMQPETELRLVLSRLETVGRGIILLHDTRLQTARMLPALLSALKARGYEVVHVVPAAAP